MLTPTGQVSFPARRAARSFWQNSSSCSRFIRILRSSSAPSETASFHLIMRPPSPLVRLGAFAIVAEERGFLKLLPCAQAHNSTTVLLRRQFAVIRPRHSPRRRYFDIGTAFQRSSRTALTGLISPFGNASPGCRKFHAQIFCRGSFFLRNFSAPSMGDRGRGGPALCCTAPPRLRQRFVLRIGHLQNFQRLRAPLRAPLRSPHATLAETARIRHLIEINRALGRTSALSVRITFFPTI